MRYTTLIFIFLLITFSTAFSAPDYFSDRLIVRFADDIDPVFPSETDGLWQFGIEGIDEISFQYSINKVHNLVPRGQNPQIWTKIDLDKVFVIYFPIEAGLFDIIDDLNRLSSVLYAEPYFIRKMDFTPNDPYLTNQYGLDNSHTQAELAWDYAQGDSDVTIAIVDSGMDMDHPDLIDNVWVNPGEDLNGNGIIDTEDWNAIDDDNNGHIDDFWGWDLMDDDNNPNDDIPASQGGGHGTHCAGIASAQTNNGQGIASLGFDCSLITVRTGEGMYIYYGYQGITYAVGVEADVISLSWGGGGYSQLEQDLFIQAYYNGASVFAAAGNDNSSSPHYPSGYDYLMAVASTNQSDIKSGFSNYGDWVDISAPGSGIYSTFLNGGYATMGGTSMACPFTAGLAGLIKSAFPAFEPQDIYDAIMETADDIDHLNPTYVGMLGAGRINAYQAMGMLYYPNLSMGEYTITDDFNNNGRAEPGENVTMVVELINLPNWQDATDIQAFITCYDDGIDITNGSSLYPDIAGGESGDNTSDPFTFYIEPDFSPQYVTFYFDLLAEPSGFTLSDSIVMLVGTPEILLVDDDDNIDNMENYYLASLNALDKNFEYWNNSESYLLPDQIMDYQMIVWFTGNAQQNTIDTYEQMILGNYLAAGGRLFLTGQYIGDEISSSSFYTDYLHAELDNPNLGEGSLTGIDGHPISSGTNLLLVGAGGAGNGLDSPSSIIPDADSQPLYVFSSDRPGGLTNVDETADSKLVYLEFAFESISGLGGPSSLNQTELMDLILTWLESPTEVEIISDFIPSTYELKQNYPNPFNPETEISFSLPRNMHVELNIYDILGRQTASLVNREMTAGSYKYSFNAEDLASGVYFAVLDSEAGKKSIKMLLLK